MIITMRILTFLLLLTSSFLAAQIEVAPLKYKKIKFSYISKSNFILIDNRVYADTTLLKLTFPKQTFTKIVSPKDSTVTIGFIEKKELQIEDLNRLKSMIFHSYTDVNYTYYKKRNCMFLTGSLCNSNECRKIFKDFFKVDTEGTTIIPTRINFKKNNKITRTSEYSTNSTDYSTKKLNWVEGNENLAYIESHNNFYKFNIVLFTNPTYPKYITPLSLFSNCESGIEKTVSIHGTTVLTKLIFR